jgi:hypothetical protein
MMVSFVPIHSLPVAEVLYSHGVPVAVSHLVRSTGRPVLRPIHTTAFVVTRCRQAGRQVITACLVTRTFSPSKLLFLFL